MSEKNFLIEVTSQEVADKPLNVTVGGKNHPFVLIEAGGGGNGADGVVRITYGGSDDEFSQELVDIALEHFREVVNGN